MKIRWILPSFLLLACISCNQSKQTNKQYAGRVITATPIATSFNDARITLIQTTNYSIIVKGYPTLPRDVDMYIIEIDKKYNYLTWVGQTANQESPEVF